MSDTSHPQDTYTIKQRTPRTCTFGVGQLRHTSKKPFKNITTTQGEVDFRIGAVLYFLMLSQWTANWIR